ncbi:MAG TPA: signal peptidase II [Ktedonobacteraceae bacterium]|nr:signal peptidase II [Ktedonobacteraceae bacterium]
MRKDKYSSVIARRARIYDVLALFTAIIVIAIDQWTKSLVVSHLSPPDIGPQVPLLGQYLTLFYITNKGAAFSMFDTNGPLLVVLIVLAVAVIVYLYLRMFNSGSLLYKLIFGLIIGGAAGNLLDRFTHGSVVDFIWFRIPQVNFSFAVFNIADAAISVGIVLLFITLIFGGLYRKEATSDQPDDATTENEPLPVSSQEQDAQS